MAVAVHLSDFNFFETIGSKREPIKTVEIGIRTTTFVILHNEDGSIPADLEVSEMAEKPISISINVEPWQLITTAAAIVIAPYVFAFYLHEKAGGAIDELGKVANSISTNVASMTATQSAMKESLDKIGEAQIVLQQQSLQDRESVIKAMNQIELTQKRLEEAIKSSQ